MKALKKGLLWFALSLKGQLRRPACWIAAVLMALVLWMISVVSVPAGTSWTVLLWNEDGDGGHQLVEQIEAADSSYDFREASSEQELIHDVRTGQAQCGFVISPGATSRIEAGDEYDIANAITYVDSPFTSLGSETKETVFAVIWQRRALTVLQNEASSQLGMSSPRERQELARRYQDFLAGDSVFHADFETVHVEGLASAMAGGPLARVQSVRSMALILVFLDLFLAVGARTRHGGPGMAMTRGARFAWEYAANLAHAIVPAIVAFAAMRLLEADRIAWWRDLCCILVLVPLADLWVMCFERLVRSRGAFVSCAFTILVSEFVLCPVFWTIGTYAPAMSLVCAVFPPGLVLLLFA